MTRYRAGVEGRSRSPQTPEHRNKQAFSTGGAPIVDPPLRVVDGRISLQIDMRTMLISGGVLSTVPVPAADPALGFEIAQTDTVASVSYDQTELQAVIDKLNELIELVQDDASRT
jgi:hypothetical protein